MFAVKFQFIWMQHQVCNCVFKNGTLFIDNRTVCKLIFRKIPGLLVPIAKNE